MYYGSREHTAMRKKEAKMIKREKGKPARKAVPVRDESLEAFKLRMYMKLKHIEAIHIDSKGKREVRHRA